MNADPAVMEHVGGLLTPEQSSSFADRIEAGWQTHGFGLYAVELRSSGAFAGFIGLSRQRILPDEVELGWRLDRSAWGRGLATEGAQAVRDLAYQRLGLRQLVSITVELNARSIRVMDKLGFEYWQSLPRDNQPTARVYRRMADTPSRAATDAR
ncbi:hypothetical protein GCM10027569_03270 [Flindersiella endophytica]